MILDLQKSPTISALICSDFYSIGETLKLKTFLVSLNRDGFALTESRTRKSGTVPPLLKMISVVRHWGYRPIPNNQYGNPGRSAIQDEFWNSKKKDAFLLF